MFSGECSPRTTNSLWSRPSAHGPWLERRLRKSGVNVRGPGWAAPFAPEDVALRGQLLAAMRDDLEDQDPPRHVATASGHGIEPSDALPPDAPPNSEPQRDTAACGGTEDDA